MDLLCLANAGVNLIIGISGSKEGVTIPTVWCSAGEIMEAVDIDLDGDPGEATPSLVEQMLDYAEQISEYAEDLDDNVIRTVLANTEHVAEYGTPTVSITDTGADENRTITFTFAYLRGMGIKSVVFTTTGTNRGRVTVKLDDDTETSYDGIKDALDDIGTLALQEIANASALVLAQMQAAAQTADNAKSQAIAAAQQADQKASEIDELVDTALETLQDDADEIIETSAAAVQAAADDVVSGAQAEINTIAAAVASMASFGTDTTLTTSGAAADAKVTGDKITDLTTQFDTAITQGDYTKKIYPTTISGSYVKSTTGAITESSSYTRTDYIEIGKVKKVKLPINSYTVNALCFYDSSKTFISPGIGSPADGEWHDVPNNAKYLIFSGANAAMTQPIIYFFSETYAKEMIANIANGNIVNGIEVSLIDGEAVRSTTGEIVSSGFSSYSRTDYVDTENYTNVLLAWQTMSDIGTPNAICFYDSTKTFISGTANPITPNDTSKQHAVPIGAKYFIVSGLTTIMPKLAFSLVITLRESSNWLQGKTINWIGDSIVAGNDFDEIVTSVLHLKENDYGVNGSTIGLKSDGTNGRNAMCTRYSDMDNNADIIAVSGGTNDFEYAWGTIGDIDSDSRKTFYGALKYLCEGLINKYPQKIIFFTTPIKRGQPFEDGNGGTYTPDNETLTPLSKNKYGKTLGDYANIIKEVCGYYSIPVLDLYNESLLNPSLESQQDMFDEYLTHPTATGQKIMARRVCGWLMQLGYNIT